VYVNLTAVTAEQASVIPKSASDSDPSQFASALIVNALASITGPVVSPITINCVNVVGVFVGEHQLSICQVLKILDVLLILILHYPMHNQLQSMGMGNHM